MELHNHVARHNPVELVEGLLARDRMTSDRVSALLSLFAALIIAGASFFRWFDAGWGGRLIPKPWVKFMLGAVVVLLVAAIAVLLGG